MGKNDGSELALPPVPDEVQVIDLSNINKYSFYSIVHGQRKFEDVDHARNILKIQVS